MEKGGGGGGWSSKMNDLSSKKDGNCEHRLTKWQFLIDFFLWDESYFLSFEVFFLKIFVL